MRLASLRGELAVCGLLIGVACLCACPPQPPCCEPESPVDAGSRADAGERLDAGLPVDAGSLEDAGTADGGQVDGGFASDAGVPADGGVLRVVASNLSSGPKQSYDPGEGIRLLKGLRPDVALIQEMNYGQN